MDITKSPVMEGVLRLAFRLAPTAATLMLLGESGTGKTWLARMIHEWSGRTGPFVVVDAGQLASSVAESELFGHEKGSFTGATSARRGLFESAEGGTLFFDEIGDMPLELQPKLLRALQERLIRRVGSSREIAVNVRVVCATCRDIRRLVAAGTFREDLWYRISTITLTMPTLAQRREDLPAILAGVAGLPDDVRDLFLAHPYDWPGHVREVINLASCAAQAGLSVEEARMILPQAPGLVERGTAPHLRRDLALRLAARPEGVRRQELAERSGMRPEHASRLLSELRAGGLLARAKGGLYVLDNKHSASANAGTVQAQRGGL